MAETKMLIKLLKQNWFTLRFGQVPEAGACHVQLLLLLLSYERIINLVYVHGK